MLPCRYGGDFRGVYFNPELGDGEFRQYAVLPIDLFEKPREAAPISATDTERPQADPTRPLARSSSPTPVIAASVGVEISAARTGGPRFRSALNLDEGKSPRSDAFASVVEELHMRGWVILPRKLLLPPDVLSAVDETPFDEPIFNGEQSGEARRRLQGRSYRWALAVEQLLAARLESVGLLACSDGSLKVVNDCYALRSLPHPATANSEDQQGNREGQAGGKDANACDVQVVGEDVVYATALAGRQPTHSDAPLPEDNSAGLSELSDVDIPLSAMVAIQKGTRLWVWPEGCPSGASADERAQLLELELGQVLVWRGDLVHAGAGYVQQHTRLHAYVDPPPHIYRRPRGRTNLCGSQQ